MVGMVSATTTQHSWTFGTVPAVDGIEAANIAGGTTDGSTNTYTSSNLGTATGLDTYDMYTISFTDMDFGSGGIAMQMHTGVDQLQISSTGSTFSVNLNGDVTDFAPISGSHIYDIYLNPFSVEVDNLPLVPTGSGTSTISLTANTLTFGLQSTVLAGGTMTSVSQIFEGTQVPEFSSVGIILAIVIIAAGGILVVKRRK